MLDQNAVAVVSRLIVDESTERRPVIFLELFQFLVPLPVGIQDIFKPDIFALRNLIEILNPPVLDGYAPSPISKTQRMLPDPSQVLSESDKILKSPTHFPRLGLRLMAGLVTHSLPLAALEVQNSKRTKHPKKRSRSKTEAIWYWRKPKPALQTNDWSY